VNDLDIPILFADERWQSALADYLRHIYEKSESMRSFVLYSYYLQEFFIDQARTGDLYSRQECERYLHQPCKSRNNPEGQPSAATRGLRLSTLKSFYLFCENYTITGPDGRPERLLQSAPPCLGIYPPKRIVKFKALDIDELRAFFAAVEANPNPVARARDRCIFIWALYTCRRRAELCRLKFKHLFRGTIREESGATREGWLYHWTGKGDAGEEHMIELPPACVEALEVYLVASGRDNVQPEDALFGCLGRGPRRSGNTALDETTVYHIWREYASRAGIDITTKSLHSLRHSGIQQRLLAGQPIMETMRVSGHKSLDTFMRYARRLDVADTGASLLEKRFDFLGGT